MAEAEEVSEDTLLDGRVRLKQLTRGHRAGTDAVLLAAAATPRPGDTVADVGAATGAVGLMIAARVPDVRLVFVERTPTLVALCRENVALNGLEDRARVIVADVLAPGLPDVPRGEADLVATNPPFLDAARSRRSPHGGGGGGHPACRGGPP